MDTAKLRVLLAAVDMGSFSKAADELGYTQSGVTHMMNALEDEIGVPLLIRGNRGVRLTAEGERLSPLIRELAACSERLEQELSFSRGLEKGRLSIGSYSSVSLRWLPVILERFQSLYPGVDVELLEGNGPEMEEWLTSGRIDLAFTSLQRHFSFDMIKLREDPMLAVVPKSHPMAGAEVFPVERFRGEPFLTYTASTQPDEDLARAMRMAGIGAKARFSSNFDQTVISMVAHNLGVTIMPRLILEGVDAEVRAIPLAPPISRTLGIAMRAGESRSPALRRFVDCAVELLLGGGETGGARSSLLKVT